MARDPVQKILSAARSGRSITLNPQEARLLATALVYAAQRLRAKRSWWKFWAAK